MKRRMLSIPPWSVPDAVAGDGCGGIATTVNGVTADADHYNVCCYDGKVALSLNGTKNTTGHSITMSVPSGSTTSIGIYAEGNLTRQLEGDNSTELLDDTADAFYGIAVESGSLTIHRSGSLSATAAVAAVSPTPFALIVTTSIPP